MTIIKYCCFGVVFLFLVSGCGGGSSSSSGNASPGAESEAPSEVTGFTLTPQATKIFRFDWEDTSGETSYKLLENPDGTSGYTEVATIDADSETHDLTVPLYQRVNASYILQACNSVGCTDSTPVTVSGELVDAIGYFKASNTDVDDDFGGKVVLSADGSTMAVSAVGEASGATGVNGNQNDNSNGEDTGAVYVFVREPDGWAQQAYLKPDYSLDGGDRFGASLSISNDGNRLAVSAPGDYSDTDSITCNAGEACSNEVLDNSLSNSGIVYVFDRVESAWSQASHIKAFNSGASDSFGTSVSLSGDGEYLAVSATGEDGDSNGVCDPLVMECQTSMNDDTASGAGAAYLYRYHEGSWRAEAYIKAFNSESGDRFGSVVALSDDGNRLAVSARREDSDATGTCVPATVGCAEESNNDLSDSGAVYLYQQGESGWEGEAFIKASNAGEIDYFGFSMALSGDGQYLAVGAPLEDSSAAGVGGDESLNDLGQAGATYVFARSTGNWVQQAYIKASVPGDGYDFGREGVALSEDGSLLLVSSSAEAGTAAGVNGDDTAQVFSEGNTGAAYVFAREGGQWSQKAYLKATNPQSGDKFSESVALSADGKTVAIGAPTEDSGSSGINGDANNNDTDSSGAVYLY